jgi:diacylglycerol kinase family enzyme
MRFPVDLGVVEFEDPDVGPRRILFLAHLAACTDPRARWWKGRTVVAMNAAFVGAANLGPRAHPNDGRLDITDGELSWGDRRRAATRAPLGAHVPHPALVERRVRELVVDADEPMKLRLDGREVATTTRFELRCLPDAATIVV